MILSIILDGENINELPFKELKKLRWNKAALVFQNSLEVLNPVMKIGSQITEPLRMKNNITSREEKEQLKELLDMVGLDYKWKEAYPHQLSGGMRQRALLAMALSCRPELLILDEPTSSLDAVSSQELQGFLQELQKELGFSMLVISHEIDTITRLTDNLMIMYQGEVVEKGSREKILENPLHPYSRGLINSSVEIFPYKDLWGIPGQQVLETKIAEKEKCPFSPRCTQALERCKEERPKASAKYEKQEVLCHQGGIVEVITAVNVAKSFKLGDESVNAVSGVDISLKHGETIALLGPFICSFLCRLRWRRSPLCQGARKK